MNRLMLILVLLLLCTSIFPIAMIGMGFGFGGSAEVPHIAIDLNVVKNKYLRDDFYYFEVSVLLNSDRVPSSLLDYPCPHNDYEILGERQLGNELGIIGKYGIEAFPQKGLFVFGLAGLSEHSDIILSQSNATGWYYQQSDSSTYLGIIGAGIAYLTQNKNNIITAQIDNRTGVTIGFSFTFPNF
jgi:hypothetical protein